MHNEGLCVVYSENLCEKMVIRQSMEERYANTPRFAKGGASRGICLRSPDNFLVISPLSGHNFGVSPSPAIFEVFFHIFFFYIVY